MVARITFENKALARKAEITAPKDILGVIPEVPGPPTVSGMIATAEAADKKAESEKQVLSEEDWNRINSIARLLLPVAIGGPQSTGAFGSQQGSFAPMFAAGPKIS